MAWQFPVMGTVALFLYKNYSLTTSKYGSNSVHPKTHSFFLQESFHPSPLIVMQVWTTCANCCWKRTESIRIM